MFCVRLGQPYPLLKVVKDNFDFIVLERLYRTYLFLNQFLIIEIFPLLSKVLEHIISLAAGIPRVLQHTYQLHELGTAERLAVYFCLPVPL